MKRYLEWEKNRNKERYELNKGHLYDGKNGCEMFRLINMSKEIASGKGLILNRRGIDRNFLLSIRNHEVPFEELIKMANSEMKEMENLFNNSKLPEEPDQKLLQDILLGIRREFYGISG